jgi:hypothetical protein
MSFGSRYSAVAGNEDPDGSLGFVNRDEDRKIMLELPWQLFGRRLTDWG